MNAIDPFFRGPFAKSATFTDIAVPPTNNVVATIKVIFEKDPSEAPGGYQNTEIAALCKTSEVQSAALNDTLTVDSVVYYIIGIEPEATGTTKLRLSLDQT